MKIKIFQKGDKDKLFISLAGVICFFSSAGYGIFLLSKGNPVIFDYIIILLNLLFGALFLIKVQKELKNIKENKLREIDIDCLKYEVIES
jgi:hypothetical protein